MSYYGRWYPPPPPTVGELQFAALKRLQEMKEAGKQVSPVDPIAGNLIARTFWGKAWCQNLLRYSDYANRMPRGRKYVRSGSVIHLKIGKGSIRALVSGTELYEVAIRIAALPEARWKSVRDECAGEIESLVDLLSGKPPKRVMEIVSRPGEGLFPSPKEIGLRCSCPDWAAMCKHVAAAMYGVGARLDDDPEQLFRLRRVSADDLLSAAVEPPAETEGLPTEDLSAIFGVALEADAPVAPEKKAVRKKAVRKKTVRKKAIRKKAVRKKTVRKKTVRKKAVRKKTIRKKTIRKKTVRKKVVSRRE